MHERGTWGDRVRVKSLPDDDLRGPLANFPSILLLQELQKLQLVLLLFFSFLSGPKAARTLLIHFGTGSNAVCGRISTSPYKGISVRSSSPNRGRTYQ